MRTLPKTALWLFVALQALYALSSSGNVFRLADEFEVYFQTESLADGRGLSVPQALALTETVTGPDGTPQQRPILFGKMGRDNRPYAPFGPLAAFLALPHHLAARGVAALAGVPREPLPGGRPWLVLVAGLTALAASTAAALTVTGIFRAALLLGCAETTALGLALILGVATAMWPYGTAFFTEAFVTCGLSWTVVLLLEARRRQGRSAAARLAGGCAVLALTGLVKANAVLLLPGFVVAALADARLPLRRRLTVAAALGAAVLVAVGVHAAYNVSRFGAPFDFGHDWAETVVGGVARPFAFSDLPRGLLVLLASPGKSIFIWAPVLVLSVGRVRACWRREPGLTAGLLASAGLLLLFYGGYFLPEGGYAHGPRHLVPLIPLWVLPLAVVPTASRGELRAVAVAGALVALLAVSTSFIQDQAMGQDLRHDNYYERVAARPGQPWNRYHLDYVPFVAALQTERWGVSAPPGAGLDFFPLHLARARRALPDMRAIPAWLPWLLPVPPLVLLGMGGWKLREAAMIAAREGKREQV